MTFDRIMVRFGELSTKGRNKMDFVRLLATNIRKKLADAFDGITLETRYDHIYVVLGSNPPESVIAALQDISGINSLSLVKKTAKDIDVIAAAALEIVRERTAETFKVKAKRGDKTFPIISDDINRIVADEILANTTLTVDVKNPDLIIGIEVREEGAYLFLDTFKGAGGYPLGSGGKVMMMISGGIDSPVASYLLMKRGMIVECIHFASPPYTSEGVIEKVRDLLLSLTHYQTTIRLHIVPFTKIQEAIFDHVDESYAVTVMRRMMYRISAKLAVKKRCQAIATGESVGQVASQTLKSMRVINEVTSLPVLRPLITYDKSEIIKIARLIKTYEISIRPFEDCCTIFRPRHPKTKPNFQATLEMEKGIDFEALIIEALENAEMTLISRQNAEVIAR